MQHDQGMILARIDTINTKGSVCIAVSVPNVSCAITGCDVKTEGKIYQVSDSAESPGPPLCKGQCAWK